MRQSVQRNKRLIEDRCAVALGGKSHYYRRSESAKKNSRGERKFSSVPEVPLRSPLARLSLVLLKGFGGEKHIKNT